MVILVLLSFEKDFLMLMGFVQKQFSELLMKAASDYGALTASVADFNGVRILRSLLQYGG